MKHLKRDVFRLAGTYLIIIMVMSLGFSVIFYSSSVRELDRRPHDDNGLQMVAPPTAGSVPLEDYLAQRAEQAREALLLDLVLVNVLALVIGGLLSYLLAERTLRPIEDNLEAQSQFVSDASHELRTPLTALRTANEVALRNKNLKLKDAKEVIRENVDDIARLQDLANSMLGLLRDDDKSLMKGSVSLQAVVADAMNMVVAQALTKNIAVDDATTALNLRGNQQSLTQLFTILLDNAIKYSDHDTTIYVASEKRARQAIITVRDEGVGMDKTTVERIFTRFYRAEQSRSTGGYGLGLPIAKKIVTTHSGKINVTSEPGKGTTFTISLPLANT